MWSEDVTIDIPRHRMVPVKTAEFVVDMNPHPFELENHEQIEAGWLREKAAKPEIFDGKVALFSALAMHPGGHLTGTCHMVRFATLLHWRRAPQPGSAEHVFAHAVPLSGDDMAIVVRMASHTVNAGLCYFAAGSIDPDDVSGGQIDIDGNMRREVREEIGLDLTDADPEAGYHLWAGEGFTVLVRRFQFAEPAEELIRRARAHIALESRSEIDDVILLSCGEARPERLGKQMQPILDWLDGKPAFTTG